MKQKLGNIKLKKINYYSNFNINDQNNKAFYVYPKNIKELKEILFYAKKNNKNILCVGNSKSWFDTISLRKGIIINLRSFRKVIKLEKRNILKISSNVKLNEVSNFLASKNLNFYNYPGYSNITIGGCISNNVHGKDSFKYGTFGEKIINIKILLSNGKIKICNKNKNKELFISIISGLGLIGIILEVQIELKTIYKNVVTKSFKCKNVKEIIDTLQIDNVNYDYIYSWIDTKRERGIIYKSKYLKKELNLKKKIQFKLKDKIIKFILSIFMKNNMMSIINYFFYILNKKEDRKVDRTQDILNLSQSQLINLPELIHPNSFVEIQFIIPNKKKNLLEKFFKILKKEHLSSLITGIKIHKKSLGYLCFSDDGLSISLNLICNFNDKNKIFRIQRIHNFIIKNKLKIYLCKDFLLKKSDIRYVYPKFSKFLKIKKKYDKLNIFASDFLKRTT